MTKDIREQAMAWAGWGTGSLILSGVVGIILLPPALQIPTKWSFDGEPRQFIGAWLAVVIIPIIAVILWLLMRHFKETLLARNTKPLGFVSGVCLCILGLFFSQGLILWGGISRLP